MLKNLPFYIKIPMISGGVFYVLSTAFSQSPDYKSRLADYIDANTVTKKQTSDITKKQPKKSTLDYKPGDWHSIVIQPQYSYLLDPTRSQSPMRDDEFKIHSYGSMNLNLSYGESMYTDKKYKQYDTDAAQSRIIQPGFVPKQELLLHMEGKVGKRMTVYVDHDSRREENQYYMQYKAVDDQETIREINAGQIDIKFDRSKYAVYDNTSNKGMGIDMTLKKNKLQVKAFASVTRGETNIEYFKGNSSPGNYKLAEYQYQKRTYYQLEAFKRYDGLSGPPPGGSGPYITYTSVPVTPKTYEPHAVNIDASGFVLYMDDQNQFNDYNAITLPVPLTNSGKYTKLQSGVDYTINFTTGVITFSNTIPKNAKICAAYTMEGGSSTSTDPSARTDIFSGKIFVFIKYGILINEDLNNNLTLDAGEDTNGDGKLNLDIYEIRSIYSIGDKYIMTDNFRLSFYDENSSMTLSDTNSLGRYTVNYSSGLIQFKLREPFRSVLSANAADQIYSEQQAGSVYDYSRFNMSIDYYREARSFKLKYFNIIPTSVRIKINGRTIPESQYSVDYTSGFLIFTNPNNPLITADTEIEIKYEYLPIEGQTQSFAGGVRADYEFNDQIKFGGSVIYTSSARGETIPTIGSEPDQTILLEGDVNLHLNEKSMGKIANVFSEKNIKSVPLEINAYAEVAKSYKTINTFGKALIDNMEALEEVVYISLSEKDWILSSMPGAIPQSDRGQLYYYFYRDPSNPGSLKEESYNATSISYSVKPGPFNIATGHIDNSIKKTTSQQSLVLDYNFASGNYIPITTRKLSDQAVDFSGLQYMEIWYRLDGSSATDAIDLHIDLGKINEDSDGDSTLDSEDTNRNGYLDTEPGSGYSEDRGYRFDGNNLTTIGSGPELNSYTQGDGILNTEDLNGNGTLDSNEQVFTLAGTATIPSTTITLNSDTGNWQRLRIYIDQDNITDSDIATLQQVENLRLYLRRNSGTTGRLFIDSIRFVSSKWRNYQLDGSSTGSDTISVTLVNSITDSDYRADAFLFAKKNIYKSLYGDKDNDELNTESESALQVDYDIPGVNNNASITQYFSRPLDLRFYKTAHLWVNYRTTPNGEIGVKLGSSSTDFIEYRFQVTNQDEWNEISLKLRSDSKGDIERYSISGIPDMKRIKYAQILFYSPGNTGTVWINDIYTSEPETLEDTAHWYESEIKVKRPLLHTDKGTPVFSNIQVKYVQKDNGKYFSSLGKPANEVAEDQKQIYTSMDILPNWKTQADLTLAHSETDSLNEDVSETLRGTTDKTTLYVLSDYQSKNKNMPSVTLTYKLDNYTNQADEWIVLNKLEREISNTIHSPTIKIHEVLENFLWGNLKATLFINMIFKNENIKRSSDILDNTAISGITSPKEKEKRQQTTTDIDLHYSNDLFYFTPKIGIGSEEVVNLSGRSVQYDSEIIGDLNGSFHVPYIYDDNFKFIQRHKKAELTLGSAAFSYSAPSYKLQTHYYENKFQDYSTIIDPDFTRKKDARTFVSTTVNIPVYISKFKSLSFFKTFNLSYTRSVNFMELEVPYEGESTGSLNEQYGLNRSFNGISGGGLNIFSYYPGYFFSGRNNYARGRDYIYNTRNTLIKLPNGSNADGYNNQLKLIDNASLATSFFFNTFTLDTNSSINQVCERLNIDGIPAQVITFNTGCDFNFDLMKIFNFSFFRPNKAGLPHHTSFFTISYTYSESMFITQNIKKTTHTPGIGLSFKWDRSNLSFNAGIDLMNRRNHSYISYSTLQRDNKDDIYIDNMPEQASFSELDRGYSFLTHYETDVKCVYNFFSEFYKLAATPIFTLDYTMKINRYDYSETVSPEPYDLYMLATTFTLDLHKNIQGGMFGKMSIEDFRNRENNGISREVFSYELGFRFSLIF